MANFGPAWSCCRCLGYAVRPVTHGFVRFMQAGMVTTLSTRTSVLGVTNPAKGAFKHGSGFAGTAATSLSGPLLSR